MRFLLLAHPTVQAVRFGSKLVLAWFLTSEDLGEAVFAGLFALGAAQVAVYGLDEALVQAPRLDAELWRAVRSLHARAGPRRRRARAAGPRAEGCPTTARRTSGSRPYRRPASSGA